MKINRAKLSVFCLAILGWYLFYPDYLFDIPSRGYFIADKYSNEFYIDCELKGILYKKKPPSLKDKEWIKEHISQLYARIEEFDPDRKYLEVMQRPEWVEGFKYVYTLIDVRGDFDDVLEGDTFENIQKLNGVYYWFKFTMDERGPKHGHFGIIYAGGILSYRYSDYVEKAKNSCSKPQ